MSRQWEPKKKTVELQPEARPSRIRREPSPGKLAKTTVVPERDERDRWVVAIGIATFTLAIVIIAVGAGSYVGWWSPSQYSLTLNAAE
jgi:hypothetical protein